MVAQVNRSIMHPVQIVQGVSNAPYAYRSLVQWFDCINFVRAIDPFGGSGSTLIACEQTDRICYTVELDEKFCDVIVKRYIEQVGGSDEVSVIRDGLSYKYSEVEVQDE